jgi:hypothetical protein
MQNLYNLMGEQHLLMSFVSHFSRQKFESLLVLVKETVAKPEIPLFIQKRLYAISVESLDNILKYINTTQQKDLPINFRSNLFIISELEQHYEIRTGSSILNDEIAILQSYVDKVNSLTKEELQKFYLDKLLKSKPEGGGLGIVEMAIKTNNKIEYNFLYETETISLLLIQTKLQK